MIRGGTPAVVIATSRARGVRPKRFAAFSEAMIRAAAPSLTPDALPAVTVPSDRTIGLSLASASMRRLARMLVLLDDHRIALALQRISTGTISSAKKPDFCAAAARCWLRSANASWSSRLTLKSTATFSAVSGIWSTPYLAFICGLTKRQPMVVS